MVFFSFFENCNEFTKKFWKTIIGIYHNFLAKPSKIDVLILSYLLPSEFSKKKETINDDIQIFENFRLFIKNLAKDGMSKENNEFSKIIMKKMVDEIESTFEQILSEKQKLLSALQKNQEMEYIDLMPEEFTKRILEIKKKKEKIFSSKKFKR